jgi:hypothetical protein
MIKLKNILKEDKFSLSNRLKGFKSKFKHQKIDDLLGMTKLDPAGVETRVRRLFDETDGDGVVYYLNTDEFKTHRKEWNKIERKAQKAISRFEDKYYDLAKSIREYNEWIDSVNQVKK